MARKRRNEELLRREGARINLHLPMVEREAETRPRSAEEVADRLLALTVVAIKGEGEDEVALQVAAERDARRLLTPTELRFFDDPAPSEHDRTQFVWRYEAAWTLFWARGWAGDEPLGLPRAICDVPRLAATVGQTPNLAVNGLRPVAQLLDETDLIYRCHWATRQAELDGVEPTGGLDSGVTMERHYALNWLTRYFDSDWDDVSTDT